ncbi:MAG: GNAT family N-acetyltransferase, partial [Alphaproteobacteria bacterium]|nr:GNAT family N-acetyltransferase [Alphaproteobacteria bacterium]
GFETIGTLTKVGKKFDKYWDVGVFELSLPIK